MQGGARLLLFVAFFRPLGVGGHRLIAELAETPCVLRRVVRKTRKTPALIPSERSDVRDAWRQMLL